MKFQIARSGSWKWLLAMFGATESRSYVEVDSEALDVRFGFFHDRIPRSEVKSVSIAARRVPWYRYSIGWRTNLAGKVGLIGAARDLVRIELKHPRSMFIGVPVSARELVISLEQPDAFVSQTAVHS